MAGPNGTFEAKFQRSGRDLVYVYDSNGALQQKKQGSSLNSLPSDISSAIATTYPGVQPQAAYKVITRNKQRYFEVVVPGRGTIDYMRFDVNGFPIGKSSLALAEQPGPDPAETVPAAEIVAEESSSTNNYEQPAYQGMPMRGESTTTVNVEVDLSEDIDIEAEMMDEDIADLFEDDDEDIEDLLNDGDDDDWEDIDLLELDDDEDDWDVIDPLF